MSHFCKSEFAPAEEDKYCEDSGNHAKHKIALKSWEYLSPQEGKAG